MKKEKEWDNYSSGSFINCKPGPHHTNTPRPSSEPFMKGWRLYVALMITLIIIFGIAYLIMGLVAMSWHPILIFGIIIVACVLVVFMLDKIINNIE